MSKARSGFLPIALIVSAMAHGQPPTPPGDKKDSEEKFEPKGAPGAGQKFLARFAGEWTLQKSFFPRTPGAEPVESTGACKQEMTHGGRFLKSEFTFDGAAGKTTGTGTIGFESGTDLFTSTWIDSRQTRMSFRKSAEKFDGKEIVLYGISLDDPKTERKSKTTTAMSKEGDTITHRQYAIGAERAADRLVMQLILKRKPKDAPK